MCKVLVVPSNRREHAVKFFEAWKAAGAADWDRAIVVWDGPEAPAIPGADAVYDWRTIDRTLGSQAWIVSRQNAGCRIFGYLMAARCGAELIATLDDDCYPASSEGLFEQHFHAMHMTPQWVTSARGMEARGLPYRHRGTIFSAINLGLWRCVGDWDAPHSLVNEEDLRHFEPDPETRIIARGQYVPISTMNLAFMREALPLMYLPLMGKNSPFDRFDDIWGGIIAKRICDHLGWRVSVGRPIVTHERASNPFTNLVKEAAGIKRNETFWLDVDRVALHASSPADAVAEIGRAFGAMEDSYMQDLGRALGAWATLTSST